jgi:hypothetical protein
LDGFRIAAGSCSKSQYTKMRVLCHQKANYLVICISSSSSVSFVYTRVVIFDILKNLLFCERTYHHEDNIARITVFCRKIIDERLRGHIEHAFFFPLILR